MEDTISRCNLFNALATVQANDANEMKGKIYSVIQAMPASNRPQEEWVEAIRNAFCKDCRGYHHDICEYRDTCNTMHVLDKFERSRR